MVSSRLVVVIVVEMNVVKVVEGDETVTGTDANMGANYNAYIRPNGFRQACVKYLVKINVTCDMNINAQFLPPQGVNSSYIMFNFLPEVP